MIRGAALLALVAAFALGVASSVGAHDDDDRDVEVKVSKVVNGRCGDLEDSLPALVASTGLAAGDVAGDVTVCVANTGEEDVLLTLRATDLVELDSRCTGEEATVDATCGWARRGELGPALLQELGVGSCPAPGVAPALARRLTELAAGSLVLFERLREQQLVCVRLRLRYEPPSAAAAVASQSDRTFWRYAFTGTARR